MFFFHCYCHKAKISTESKWMHGSMTLLLSIHKLKINLLRVAVFISFCWTFFLTFAGFWWKVVAEKNIFPAFCLRFIFLDQGRGGCISWILKNDNGEIFFCVLCFDALSSSYLNIKEGIVSVGPVLIQCPGGCIWWCLNRGWIIFFETLTFSSQ